MSNGCVGALRRCGERFPSTATRSGLILASGGVFAYGWTDLGSNLYGYAMRNATLEAICERVPGACLVQLTSTVVIRDLLGRTIASWRGRTRRLLRRQAACFLHVAMLVNFDDGSPGIHSWAACMRVRVWSGLWARPAPRRAVVIWLILPVVICLFQRLSHACLSISELIQ